MTPSATALVAYPQAEIAPHAERWRKQGMVDREAYLKAGAQGYLLMWADEKYGGAGVAVFGDEQVLIEENIRSGKLMLLPQPAFAPGGAVLRPAW